MLAAEPCQSVCRWAAQGEWLDDASGGGLRLFACAGCGSEWVRTEAWTPADVDGDVPVEVAAERARADRADRSA